MSFLLKVISFPSQAEQSSGPRGLGNLFHKTDSLASIQSLGTTQPRRTNKSFSDAAPDTLRCMFHSFIPAFILFASCSNKKRGAESTSKPTRKQNQSITLSFGSWKKKWVHRVSCVSGAGLPFQEASTFGELSAILWSCPQCFRTCVSAGSDRGFNEADKASSVAAFGRGGAKGRLLAHGLGIVLGSRDQPAPNPAPAWTQLGNFLFNRPNWDLPEKGNRYKISSLLPKKNYKEFFSFFGSHTQSPDWKSPVGDKTHLCCGKIVVTIGEGWWKGTGALADWCDPYFHQHTGGVGVLLVKILQAVHTGTFLYVCSEFGQKFENKNPWWISFRTSPIHKADFESQTLPIKNKPHPPTA